MNPIGAFSFGRILKTFLPGFMALLGLWLCLDARFYWLYQASPIWCWVQANASAAMFASVPLSLACGMILNALSFSYLLDPLIRAPYQKEHPGFAILWKGVGDHLRAKTESLPEDPEASTPYWDLEYFLLPLVPMEKYTFLEESYWYYLEFCLNFLLALALDTLAISFALLAWFSHKPSTRAFPWFSLIVMTGVVALLFRAMLTAARRDFEKHNAKKLSLLLGSLYAKEIFK